jgi:hypothetical protein
LTIMVGNACASRRIATFHHATLRVAPHRYATREPLGTPGGSRAFGADGHPQEPVVQWQKDCNHEAVFQAYKDMGFNWKLPPPLPRSSGWSQLRGVRWSG